MPESFNLSHGSIKKISLYPIFITFIQHKFRFIALQKIIQRLDDIFSVFFFLYVNL
jgi:hypothetical protein